MPKMTVQFVAFPSGSPVPGSASFQLPVSEGGDALVGAPADIFEPGVVLPYVFGFWVINAQTYLTASASVPIPANDFTATAWYFQGGGQNVPVVTTYAFSVNQDVMLASQTPIASVVPASDWAGGAAATVSDAGTAVAITALPTIPGAGRFQFWMIAEGSIVPTPVLNVAANQDVQAIALYAIPTPDPCAVIRAELDDISPGDFPNFPAYQHARAALLGQLVTCERQYGELV